MTIYGDLLSALRSEEKAERIVLIRVQLKIKVPFNRLKKYIEELVDLGLVQDETSLKITEKGRLFIREYKRISEFMKQMGISYR
jgi:predicted transcriptional regulator